MCRRMKKFMLLESMQLVVIVIRLLNESTQRDGLDTVSVRISMMHTVSSGFDVSSLRETVSGSRT